jgi:hypothetical protein
LFGIRALVSNVFKRFEVERPSGCTVQVDARRGDVCDAHAIRHHDDHVFDLLPISMRRLGRRRRKSQGKAAQQQRQMHSHAGRPSRLARSAGKAWSEAYDAPFPRLSSACPPRAISRYGIRLESVDGPPPGLYRLPRFL